MKYELIKGSNAGVIIDPTPILLDVKDTFEVSFVLPDDGGYIALFRGEENAEYKVAIKNGVARIPKELFKKEQRVGLTVCQVSEEEIANSWECQSLKIGAFLYLRQTQWQVTAGVDDSEIFSRIAELEESHGKTQIEFGALQDNNKRSLDEFNEARQEYAKRLVELNKTLASIQKANETLANEYNKAIEVINNLSERVYALEKNYDPTIIK